MGLPGSGIREGCRKIQVPAAKTGEFVMEDRQESKDCPLAPGIGS